MAQISVPVNIPYPAYSVVTVPLGTVPATAAAVNDPTPGAMSVGVPTLANIAGNVFFSNPA